MCQAGSTKGQDSPVGGRNHLIQQSTAEIRRMEGVSFRGLWLSVAGENPSRYSYPEMI